MDELHLQISKGLSESWKAFQPSLELPDNVSVAYGATNGTRCLLFLRVTGHMRSALPLFETNTQLRKLGIEPVWLFENEAIPSTKHMICTVLNWMGEVAMVTIVNVDKSGVEADQRIEISVLATAAAQERLKTVFIQAGQRVSVSCTSDMTACSCCGAVSQHLNQATFQLVDNPCVPVLALPLPKIGLFVSRLIAEELAPRGAEIAVRSKLSNQDCPDCRCVAFNAAHTTRVKYQYVASIVLSSMAALELLKHHKTAWYIA